MKRAVSNKRKLDKHTIVSNGKTNKQFSLYTCTRQCGPFSGAFFSVCAGPSSNPQVISAPNMAAGRARPFVYVASRLINGRSYLPERMKIMGFVRGRGWAWRSLDVIVCDVIFFVVSMFFLKLGMRWNR